jgi:hypothetical protein
VGTIRSLTALRALPAIAAGSSDLTDSAYSFLKGILSSSEFDAASKQIAISALFGFNLAQPLSGPAFYTAWSIADGQFDVQHYDQSQPGTLRLALDPAHFRNAALTDEELRSWIVRASMDPKIDPFLRGTALICMTVPQVSDDTLQPVIEALDRPAPPVVRLSAASAIVRMGATNDVAGGVMRATLSNEPNPKVVYEILLALSRSPSRRYDDLAPILNERLKVAFAARVQDPTEHEHAAHIGLIAQLLGERYYSQAASRSDAKHALIAIASHVGEHPESIVVSALARVFSETGDEELIRALQASLSGLSPSRERDRALEDLETALSTAAKVHDN